jgi:hypothetical protein
MGGPVEGLAYCKKTVRVVRPECVTTNKIAGYTNQRPSRNQELPRKAIPPFPPSRISDSFAEPPAKRLCGLRHRTPRRSRETWDCRTRFSTGSGLALVSLWAARVNSCPRRAQKLPYSSPKAARNRATPCPSRARRLAKLCPRHPSTLPRTGLKPTLTLSKHCPESAPIVTRGYLDAA